MNPYYFNEAVIDLGDIRWLVDSTRHHLEVATAGGAELRLEIERSPLADGATLRAAVEATLAERIRSVRQFEIMSRTDRAYPEVDGLEITLTFIDKERGPLFVHEFHCAFERTHVCYRGSCRIQHSAACDEWMRATLQSLRPRSA